MRICPSPLVLVCALLATASAAANEADGWADVMRVQVASGEPLPRLSAFVPDAGLALAYAVQQAVVGERRRQRAVAGYKAAFMTAPAQAAKGLGAPASGVLFDAGAHADGAQIPIAHYRSPALSLCLGFRLRSPIRRLMRSVDDLLTYVAEVVPVVELPDLNLDDADAATGADIVAVNLGAAAWVAGSPLRLDSLADVNTLTVKLYRDGREIDVGHARNAMGDQLVALLWLVNHLYARGETPRPGQILLTGPLGTGTAARPGHYQSRFGGQPGPSFELLAAAAGVAQIRPQ
ncbi:MAG: 2-keto-4-pentenoate hydratase [Gammaproteobacteria bacterium]